jgi:hypothetical protein
MSHAVPYEPSRTLEITILECYSGLVYVQVPQLEYVYNIAATELVMRVAKHIFTSYLQVLLSNR